MLRIRRIEHLARHLKTTPNGLRRKLESCEDCYQELVLKDPARPDKPRDVLNVTGVIRQFQELLYATVLLPRLPIPTHAHGSIPGRSIRSNALAHRNSAFLMKADISNFYPSVKNDRVYGMFLKDFKCSPDVARLCTKLCTHKYHLALGLTTSPILANYALADVDQRIAGLCLKAGLQYTRYVDDITISGCFNFKKSGFPDSISAILSEHGFSVNNDKLEFGRVVDGLPITGIRVRKSGLDISREYADLVASQINMIRQLARGDRVDGPYATESQLLGRVNFVRWINPSRGKKLIQQTRRLKWNTAMRNAMEFGLVNLKKSLNRKAETIA